MIVPIVRQAINAGNKDYKEFIVEDNIFLFDSTLGVYA